MNSRLIYSRTPVRQDQSGGCSCSNVSQVGDSRWKRNSSGGGPRRIGRLISCGVVLIGLLGGSVSRAAVFLDLASVTPGSAGVGAFSGTLGTVGVSGFIVPGAPSLSFNPVGPGIGDSTIAGTSPQFSYPSVFSPTALGADRVGFTYLATSTNLVSVSFSAPVTNPVFHFANIDWAGFSFGPTLGLSSLTLLSGNHGPDSDGIDPTFGGAPYSFLFVHDAAPPTTDSTPPFVPPPTGGPRSAYASVQLNGTFTTVGFAADALGPFTDSGSFTISIVPEPGILGLLGLGALGLGGFVRRRADRTELVA